MNFLKKIFGVASKKIDTRTVIYSPKEDITSYEVAKCLEIIIFSHSLRWSSTFDTLKSKIESYPPNIHRHFKLKG